MLSEKTIDKATSKMLDHLMGYFGTNIEGVMSKSRKRENVMTRQIAMKVLRENKNTDISLAMVGYKIGRRDHATVMHAINEINNLCYTDKYLKSLVNEVQELFNQSIKECEMKENEPEYYI